MPTIGWIIVTIAAFSSIWGVNAINNSNKQESISIPVAPIVEQKNTSTNNSGFESAASPDLKIKTETSINESETQLSRVKETAPVKTEQSSCHPSYSGCLKPDASDYDCSGGSGNGPYYTGPVRVYGPDVFDLDRDGDGVACE